MQTGSNCAAVKPFYGNLHVGQVPQYESGHMNAIWTVEKIVRDVMQPDKINLASLGNMVPHLHWHVIPRFENDKNFPDSIWSQTRRAVDVNVMNERMARASGLKNALCHALEKQFM